MRGIKEAGRKTSLLIGKLFRKKNPTGENKAGKPPLQKTMHLESSRRKRKEWRGHRESDKEGGKENSSKGKESLKKRSLRVKTKGRETGLRPEVS